MTTEILPYSSELRPWFESLNREWLEKLFVVEPIDLKYFADPEKEIIAKGGEIYFARIDGEILGTCSLVWDEGELELAKMGVTEKAKGKGIGEALVRHCIERAKAMKVKKLKLVTNSGLIPAIRLYEKMGFVTTYRGPHPKYARGDVFMEINF